MVFRRAVVSYCVEYTVIEVYLIKSTHHTFLSNKISLFQGRVSGNRCSAHSEAGLVRVGVWVSQEISGSSQRHRVDYGITGSSRLPIVPVAWDQHTALPLRDKWETFWGSRHAAESETPIDSQGLTVIFPT